jgi:hypothetical protein
MTEAFNDGAHAWMAYAWFYPPRKGGVALIHLDKPTNGSLTTTLPPPHHGHLAPLQLPPLPKSPVQFSPPAHPSALSASNSPDTPSQEPCLLAEHRYLPRQEPCPLA